MHEMHVLLDLSNGMNEGQSIFHLSTVIKVLQNEYKMQ